MLLFVYLQVYIAIYDAIVYVINECTLSETRTVVWNDFLLNFLTA